MNFQRLVKIKDLIMIGLVTQQLHCHGRLFHSWMRKLKSKKSKPGFAGASQNNVFEIMRNTKTEILLLQEGNGKNFTLRFYLNKIQDIFGPI